MRVFDSLKSIITRILDIETIVRANEYQEAVINGIINDTIYHIKFSYIVDGNETLYDLYSNSDSWYSFGDANPDFPYYFQAIYTGTPGMYLKSKDTDSVIGRVQMFNDAGESIGSMVANSSATNEQWYGVSITMTA